LHDEEQVAHDIRPSVAYQVFFLIPTDGEDLEVVHSLLMPAGPEVLGRVRIRRAIGSHVDGRRLLLLVRHIDTLLGVMDPGMCLLA
jgi:hypothetical protein